jgi:hypothetical protein
MAAASYPPWVTRFTRHHDPARHTPKRKNAAGTSLGKGIAKGCAVDVFFGIVLLVFSTFISDFGVAWVMTMGVVIGLWALWHIFNSHNPGSPSKRSPSGMK